MAFAGYNPGASVSEKTIGMGFATAGRAAAYRPLAARFAVTTGLAVVAGLAATVTAPPVWALEPQRQNGQLAVASGSASGSRSDLAQSPGTPAQAPLRFDIPGQPLPTALLAFGRQAGLQVTVDSRATVGKQAPAVIADISPEEALTRLLAGSGLTWRYVDARTVTLEPADVRPESGPMRLGPVTVTARRTEELLQDVPGSVFVLGSEDLERSNVQDLEDLALRTPNFNITESGSRDATRITVRGISDINTLRSSAPTVGVYVDEVMLNPTGSAIGLDPNLFDLERAEVTYGPQGTAFGRGTIGGAVNYVTKKPTEDFEAELEGEVGSFPDGLARAVVNGSLTGDRTLMGRLVAFGRYDDGFIDTPNIGGSNDAQDYGARLSLRSQPTDRLTLDLAGSFDRTDFVANNLATIDSIEGDGDLEFLINRRSDSRIDRRLFTLRGSYDFDVGTLISNTSYLDVATEFEGDGDDTELDFFINDAFERDQTSFAQEIRFEAEPFKIPRIGRTNLLIGLNSMWAEESFESTTIAGTDSTFQPPGTASSFANDEEVFDLGFFGELRVRPIEKLEVALGGRFSYTEVEGTQEGLETAESSFNAFTPKGSILYDWTDSFSTYALISTGFKSGGFNAFNTGSLSAREFDNETAINYEAGFKSNWFDNRLFVNASGFALFYDDIQVVSRLPSPPNATAVQNAGSARSVGGELDIVALPAEGLQLNVAYGFSDAQFTDYEDAPRGDATGERLPNASRHTLSAVGEYAFPVLDGFADAYLRTEYSYTSSFTLVAEADAEVFDPYDILNLRVGLRADRFDIELFGENLLDETYIVGGSGPGDFLANTQGVSEPFEVGTARRFGIRAKLRF